MNRSTAVKTILGTALAAFALSLASAQDAPQIPTDPGGAPACTPKHGLAPADEYFGPQRLSPLGVPIHINFLSDHYSSAPNSDPKRKTASDVLNDAASIELSVKEIEYCYPEDTLLPRAILSLERVYEKIGAPGAAKAAEMKAWLRKTYPSSPSGRISAISTQLENEPPLGDGR